MSVKLFRQDNQITDASGKYFAVGDDNSNEWISYDDLVSGLPSGGGDEIIAAVANQADYEAAYANGTRVFLIAATIPTSFNLTGSEIQTFYQYNNVRHTLTTTANNSDIVLFCENISVVTNASAVTLRGKVGELHIPLSLGNDPRIEGMQVSYLNSERPGLEIIRCDVAYCQQDTTATDWYFFESNIGVYNLIGASRNDTTQYQRVNVGVVENMNTLHWGLSLIGTGWSTVTGVFNLSVADGSMVKVRDVTTLTP